jgi:hypothetical protein
MGGVKWSRLQFPLRPGFVITMHKSQGTYLTVSIIIQAYQHSMFRTNLKACWIGYGTLAMLCSRATIRGRI